MSGKLRLSVPNKLRLQGKAERENQEMYVLKKDKPEELEIKYYG